MRPYEHTQRAPLYLLLIVIGASMLVAGWQSPGAARTLLLVTGALVLLLAAAFRELTVRDESDHLLMVFGPLPLFRRRVPYADIEDAQRGRTTILDGWGIHLSPRGGWTWNLWGFDCVDVRLSRGRRLHIGTDDPDGLAEFLKSRIARSADAPHAC